MESNRIFSAYRNMWLIVMFDLPTETPEDKKMYRDFRVWLLSDGFEMVQYSVYLRYCASPENATVHEKRIMNILPPTGNIRMIQFTDKQFERMRLFFWQEEKKVEIAPNQLTFF